MDAARIRKYENIHIVFWLIKDSCWMLQLKGLGTLVMIPTLFVATHLVIRTRHTHEFFLNCAILAWIVANSYWMMIEFFNHDRYKLWAAVPFAIGLIMVTIHYLTAFRSQRAPLKH